MKKGWAAAHVMRRSPSFWRGETNFFADRDFPETKNAGQQRAATGVFHFLYPLNRLASPSLSPLVPTGSIQAFILINPLLNRKNRIIFSGVPDNDGFNARINNHSLTHRTGTGIGHQLARFGVPAGKIQSRTDHQAARR